MTFEEFYNSVAEGLDKALTYISKDDACKFMDKEIEIVKERYATELWEIEQGESTPALMRTGGVPSLVHCFSLMYE